MIQRDPEDPNNVATIWLVDTEGFLRGVYHAASEDAIRDAVEDIALLKKERDVAEYAREKLTEALEVHPELPVLGPEGHTIPAFAFTGIDSVEISHRTVEGQVKIVDYFFTHCPTICPIMSSQLARTQAWLKGHDLDDEVMLMSHSVDPIRDTPARLKTYATRLGRGHHQLEIPHRRQGRLVRPSAVWVLPHGARKRHGRRRLLPQRHLCVGRPGKPHPGLYDGTSTAEVDAMMLDAAALVVTDRR